MRPLLLPLFAASLAFAEPRQISGIYPSLATFNNEGECGTGAVVPWADRLWVISYGPHRPYGSSDKLYEITPDLQQIVRPESIGGTPANRFIHRESNQLFIGPYAIDAQRTIRTIPWQQMPGRLTGTARHLTDPANKIYIATMEAGLYEVDVHSLAVTGLLRDRMNKPAPGSTAEAHPATTETKLPGWHGKGLYSGQGRLVFSNNGEHGKAAETDPDTTAGALGERGVDGDFRLVRRAQFTEVSGPGGIYGNSDPAKDPVWATGWDRRSLILQCLESGTWHTYRLPKPSHTYDGAHGWHTEWPRIREIGEGDLLMTMHGGLWRFPKTFSATHSAGVAPRSTHLSVTGDFCRWNDRVVFGCDVTAKSGFLNGRKAKGDIVGPGQSQSNLWFVFPTQLDQLGTPLGRGAVWWNDEVAADSPSDPYLFSGFQHRSVWLQHRDDTPLTVSFEVDREGIGQWADLKSITVPPGQATVVEFTPAEAAAWIRLRTDRAARGVSAFFHYRNDDPRPATGTSAITGLATTGDATASSALLHARGANLRTLGAATADAYYELDGDLQLRKKDAATDAEYIRKHVAIPHGVVSSDAASALYIDESGKRWRLPKGAPEFDQPSPFGDERVDREVATERDLFNCHGTFYELPAESSGGFAKIRPITTHNRRIKDYATYRGMLVLSGITDSAQGDHIVRSDDGKLALWLGAIDDLWQFGKARGHGGPWKDTAAQADQPSDPYLISGYDKKKLTLRSSAATTIRLEADYGGKGEFITYREFTLPAGGSTSFDFPASFGAYWVRFVSTTDTSATAELTYE